MSDLAVKIANAYGLVAGEEKTWASANEDGLSGARAQMMLDEDGVLRLNVVEWQSQGSEVVLALDLDAEGQASGLVGVSDGAEDPVSECLRTFRFVVANMKLVD